MNEEQYRILVVDDECHMRNIAKIFLEKEGYFIETATDGYDALKKISNAEEPFDLYMSDWHMPNMGGAEFFSRVKHHPAIKIITSGRATIEQIKSDERTSSVMIVLRKPYVKNDLCSLVKKVLKNKKIQ